MQVCQQRAVGSRKWVGSTQCCQALLVDGRWQAGRDVVGWKGLTWIRIRLLLPTDSHSTHGITPHVSLISVVTRYTSSTAHRPLSTAHCPPRSAHCPLLTTCHFTRLFLTSCYTALPAIPLDSHGVAGMSGLLTTYLLPTTFYLLPTACRHARAFGTVRLIS